MSFMSQDSIITSAQLDLTLVPSFYSDIPLVVPSAAVLKYMEEVISVNSTDGSQLLPIQSDVATQAYTVRANLGPRSSQVG